MKTTRKRLRMLCFVVSALMLLQSCVVYHKTPVSLAKAAEARTKSKLVTADGIIFKYNYITMENGRYYGVTKKSGQISETTIVDSLNTRVYLKHKRKSRNATWVLIMLPVGALLLIENNKSSKNGSCTYYCPNYWE